MSLCLICGKNVRTDIETILVSGNNAAVVSFGKNYCFECAGKRIEELRKALRKGKNVLSLTLHLNRFEEMKVIEG
jgi:hypothetical protein